jgi:hypothetical protein
MVRVIVPRVKRRNPNLGLSGSMPIINNNPNQSDTLANPCCGKSPGPNCGNTIGIPPLIGFCLLKTAFDERNSNSFEFMVKERIVQPKRESFREVDGSRMVMESEFWEILAKSHTLSIGILSYLRGDGAR